MTFEQLNIHLTVKSVLERSLEDGRIAHAQYFEGTDGGGNLSMAIAYAQGILAGKVDMFGGVDLRASHLEHPDLHIVFPMVQSVDKTCDSSVQEFREAYKRNPYLSYSQWLEIRDEKTKKAIISKHEAVSISKKLSLRSFEGGYKIVLIWMPELMNQDCANALLKLIEEPPQKALILMVGEDASSLLPTIRSRVQVLPFAPLSFDEVFETLKMSRTEDENILRKAAEFADGSVAKAMDEIQHKDDAHAGEIMSWLRLCYQMNVEEVINWCDTVAGQGREEAQQVLRQCMEIFRMSFRKNYNSISLSADKELEVFTQKFAPFVNELNAEKLQEVSEKALLDIGRNGNARIVLLDYSFKVIKLLRVK